MSEDIKKMLGAMKPEDRAALAQEFCDSDEVKVLVQKRAVEAVRDQIAGDSYDFGRKDSEGRAYLANDFQAKGLTKKGDQEKRIRQLNDEASFLHEALMNCGRVRRAMGREFTLQDLATTADAPLLFPKVISNVVKEPMEAESNVAGLFQRIEFHNGPTLVTPVMGSASGRNLEIPEGGEYNELVSEFSGFMTATIAKQGIKVSITEEVKRYSILDLYNMYLRLAGKALGRWKEVKAVRALTESATVAFDNANPTAGVVTGKPTSGRNRNGILNGTFMLMDLFDLWCYATDRGASPQLVIMNPLAWKIFATDPIVRQYMLSTQGTLFKPFSGGKPGVYNPGAGGLSNVFGERGASNPNGAYGISAPNLDTRKFEVPGALGVPFTVMVTPYVPARKVSTSVYDAAHPGTPIVANQLVTDIFVVDPTDVGLHVVDEDVISDSFQDVYRDISTTKLRERYGFCGNNNGNGLFVVKNVVVARGYDLENLTQFVNTVADLNNTNVPTVGDVHGSQL